MIFKRLYRLFSVLILLIVYSSNTVAQTQLSASAEFRKVQWTSKKNRNIKKTGFYRRDLATNGRDMFEHDLIKLPNGQYLALQRVNVRSGLTSELWFNLNKRTSFTYWSSLKFVYLDENFKRIRKKNFELELDGVPMNFHRLMEIDGSYYMFFDFDNFGRKKRYIFCGRFDPVNRKFLSKPVMIGEIRDLKDKNKDETYSVTKSHDGKTFLLLSIRPKNDSGERYNGKYIPYNSSFSYWIYSSNLELLNYRRRYHLTDTGKFSTRQFIPCSNGSLLLLGTNRKHKNIDYPKYHYSADVAIVKLNPDSTEQKLKVNASEVDIVDAGIKRNPKTGNYELICLNGGGASESLFVTSYSRYVIDLNTLTLQDPQHYKIGKEYGIKTADHLQKKTRHQLRKHEFNPKYKIIPEAKIYINNSIAFWEKPLPEYVLPFVFNLDNIVFNQNGEPVVTSRQFYYELRRSMSGPSGVNSYWLESFYGGQYMVRLSNNDTMADVNFFPNGWHSPTVLDNKLICFQNSIMLTLDLETKEYNYSFIDLQLLTTRRYLTMAYLTSTQPGDGKIIVVRNLIFFNRYGLVAIGEPN